MRKTLAFIVFSGILTFTGCHFFVGNKPKKRIFFSNLDTEFKRFYEKKDLYPLHGEYGIQKNLIIISKPEYPEFASQVLVAIQALEEQIGCRPFLDIQIKSVYNIKAFFNKKLFPGYYYTFIEMVPEDYLPHHGGRTKWLVNTDDRHRKISAKIFLNSNNIIVTVHEMLHSFDIDDAKQGIMRSKSPDWNFSYLAKNPCDYIKSRKKFEKLID